jgi:hypothetical protein
MLKTRRIVARMVGVRGPVGRALDGGVAAGEWGVVAGEWGAAVGGDGVGLAEWSGACGLDGSGNEALGAGILGGLVIRGGCARPGAVWTGFSVAVGM